MAENEVGNWKISTRCSTGTCVQIKIESSGVRVRESDGDGTALSFSADAWRAFLADLRR